MEQRSGTVAAAVLSFILVLRAGLPQYPMKNLPLAHNSDLAMPQPLGSFGFLPLAIAPTAQPNRHPQAFALRPTFLDVLLATLGCTEAQPEILSKTHN
jgi:hypothetical protein